MTLDVLIEVLLFYKAAPQNKQRLLKLFAVPEEEFSTALQTLRNRLTLGATRLIETETEIQLATAPELSEFIEQLCRQDLSGDIGKAGAETLAIILYREPISRTEIDRIRGVNSSFILRNLLTRGLITRESITGNGFNFRISPALLQHLGVEKKHELPKFSEFMEAIDNFDTQGS
ncbi:SMC-Scp complex subunit ScpB [Candidatus Kaiserbacteria bacterium]|nr:SMC-Scp complex subunit ScpB [Candidatus Kaiserbacteria bacterium]NCT01740.1 SMC-Scp complex subunit ScpB [Candidatus Parcubacteria bacterium]